MGHCASPPGPASQPPAGAEHGVHRLGGDLGQPAAAHGDPGGAAVPQQNCRVLPRDVRTLTFCSFVGVSVLNHWTLKTFSRGAESNRENMGGVDFSSGWKPLLELFVFWGSPKENHNFEGLPQNMVVSLLRRKPLLVVLVGGSPNKNHTLNI